MGCMSGPLSSCTESFQTTITQSNDFDKYDQIYFGDVEYDDPGGCVGAGAGPESYEHVVRCAESAVCAS